MHEMKCMTLLNCFLLLLLAGYMQRNRLGVREVASLYFIAIVIASIWTRSPVAYWKKCTQNMCWCDVPHYKCSGPQMFAFEEWWTYLVVDFCFPIRVHPSVPKDELCIVYFSRYLYPTNIASFVEFYYVCWAPVYNNIVFRICQLNANKSGC